MGKRIRNIERKILTIILNDKHITKEQRDELVRYIVQEPVIKDYTSEKNRLKQVEKERKRNIKINNRRFNI